MSQVKLPDRDIPKGQPIQRNSNLEDDKWTIDKRSNTETHTFYLFTKDNAFIFCQLAYAKISFVTNVQVTFSVIDGDKNIFLTNTCSGFKTLNNNLDCTSDSMSVTRGSDNSFTVKLLEKSGAKGEFIFKTEGTGIKIGDSGTTTLGGTDNITHNFYCRMLVEGTISVPKFKTAPYDLTGSIGYFGHASLSNKPYSAFKKSNFFLFNSERVQILSLNYLPIDKHNYPHLIDQTFIFLDKELVAATSKATEVPQKEIKDNVGLTLPVDTKFLYEGNYLINNGQSEGRQLKATVHLDDLKVVERVDILATIPYLLRKVVQAFITNPYLYQFYQDAKVQLKVDEGLGKEELNIECTGKLIYELSYL